MFPEVTWPATRPRPSLFVPASAIATTTERTFVIRIRNGATEWVDAKRGVSMGDLVEVFGDLQENDIIAVRGADELRAGIAVNTKPSPSLAALPPHTAVSLRLTVGLLNWSEAAPQLLRRSLGIP